jgi:hypothetical protein
MRNARWTMLFVVVAAGGAHAEGADAGSTDLGRTVARASNGKLVAASWVEPIPQINPLNPCSLAGDFDADGKKDLAILVEESSGKRRKGILIVRAVGEPLVAGAGIRIGNGGDEYSWMDSWRLVPSSDRPKAKGDALWVERTESASGVLSWNGKKLVWQQKGD